MKRPLTILPAFILIAAAIALLYSPAGPPAPRTPEEAPRAAMLPAPPPPAASSTQAVHSTAEANLPGGSSVSAAAGTASVTLSNNDAAPRSGETELRGKLRMVGNAPFYEFVITVDGKTDYYIKAKKSEQEGLMKHQSRAVRAVGTVEKEDLKYPNPIYNHTRHYIFPRILDIY